MLQEVIDSTDSNFNAKVCTDYVLKETEPSVSILTWGYFEHEDGVHFYLFLQEGYPPAQHPWVNFHCSWIKIPKFMSFWTLRLSSIPGSFTYLVQPLWPPTHFPILHSFFPHGFLLSSSLELKHSLCSYTYLQLQLNVIYKEAFLTLQPTADPPILFFYRALCGPLSQVINIYLILWLFL